MHLLKAPDTVAPWSTRAINKHNRYLEAYKTCGIKIVDDYKILDFINENVKHLENRPNQFQHDDFHVGNIILKDKKYKGVIDFNNHDWGDPIQLGLHPIELKKRLNVCTIYWRIINILSFLNQSGLVITNKDTPY